MRFIYIVGPPKISRMQLAHEKGVVSLKSVVHQYESSFGVYTLPKQKRQGAKAPPTQKFKMVMTFRGYNHSPTHQHEVEIEETGENEVEVISTARWASLDQCGNILDGSPARQSKRSLMDQETDDDDDDDDGDSLEIAVERTQISPPKSYKLLKGWSAINEIDGFLSSMEMGIRSRTMPEPIREEEEQGTLVFENSTISTLDQKQKGFEKGVNLSDTMSVSTKSSLDTAEKKERAKLAPTSDAPNPATEEKTRDAIKDETTRDQGVSTKSREEEDNVGEHIKRTKTRICKLVILLIVVIAAIIAVVIARSERRDSAARVSIFNETAESNPPSQEITNPFNPLDVGADGSNQPDDLSQPTDIGGSSQPVVPSQPVPVNPPTLSPSASEPLMASLQSLYNSYGMDSTPLQPPAYTGDATPQHRAYLWLSQDDQRQYMNDPTQMTRYALAVFYFATNAVSTAFEMDPDPWQVSNGWLTQSGHCLWYGIICDFQGRVESIELPINLLSGSLPLELRFFEDTLYHIDITNNGITMSESDYDVFLNLVYLEEFYADNNYLESENGLPSQMASLVNLEALAVSYNVLGGDLSSNSVLQSMPALWLIEIEGNFFSGSVPNYFGNMANLVYMYMRHNQFTGNLSFFGAGQMESLCKLFLLHLSPSGVWNPYDLF